MKLSLIIWCWLSALTSVAQVYDSVSEHLQATLKDHPRSDTIRVNRLVALARQEKTTGQSFRAYQEALELARRLHYTSGEAQALLGLGYYYRFRNEYEAALTHTLQAQKLFEQLDDRAHQISCLYNLAFAVYAQGDFAQAMAYSFEGLRMAEALRNQRWLTLMNSQLGIACITVGEYAKAQHYLLRGLKLATRAGDKEGAAFCLDGLGRLAGEQRQWAKALQYFEQQMKLAHEANNERLVTLGQLRTADMSDRLGRYPQAFAFGRQGLRRLRQLEDVGNIPLIQVVLARAHLHTGRADSALIYAQTSLRASQRSGTKSVSREASEVLAKASAQLGRFADAYRYQQLFVAYKDSLSSQDLIRRTAALQYQYALDTQKSQIGLLTRNEQLIRQQNRQQQMQLIGALLSLVVVAGLSVLLWHNNRQKQQANKQLRRQQQELQAAQAQLIQREKMASLGELTAGIAHEMQNPLNFVANFAEVSTDLINELRETRGTNGELEDELLDDLTLNLQKITQYGQQAARIVRGMVEHARPNSGERQPSDLNALCEEYLRLAYHGLRAQDKQLTVETATDLAPLPLVNMVGAELGQVLHNLLTNAFYAVRQRQREDRGGYQPKVSVSTRLRKGQVIIKVRDNGTGIPKPLQAKIFQPFFTTKPPGEGIGLGLSLSYTIITQGHGGTLTVESVEGEFTEFTISLPAYATPYTPSDAHYQPEIWAEQHH